MDPSSPHPAVTAARPRNVPRKPAPPNEPWTPVVDSRWGETARALAAALAITAPIVAAGAAIMYADHAAKATARAAHAELVGAYERLIGAPAAEALPLDQAVRGRDLFRTACGACHGPEGAGVTGLGKDLVHSWFVASLDDHALGEFLREGRAADAPGNTTRLPMPAMGGRTDLTSADLEDLVAYMRGLQDPRRMPQLPAYVAAAPAPPSQSEMAAALAAAGGDEELAEYIASGSKLYASACAACHAPDARGIAGNGKPLVNNPFCDSLDDDSLLAFLKRGRDPSDPANTTGVGMPPKGGNPALDDDDLLDIIAYLRSLASASSGTH